MCSMQKTCLVYTVVALWCTSDVQGQCQWKGSRGEMEVQDMRAGRGGWQVERQEIIAGRQPEIHHVQQYRA